MSAKDRRAARDRAKEEADTATAEPPPPSSPEEAIARYREEARARVAELEQGLAEAGGRRDGLPPAPSPEDVLAYRARKEKQAAYVPTDEDLGIGVTGIAERRVKGVGAAWNFTMGPVLIYEGPHMIKTILEKQDPIVLVAKYIHEEEYKKIDRTRVRGIILEEGSIVDPMYWFLKDENRAAIVGAKGAMELCINDEDAVVDGVRGVVYFGPCPLTIRDYEYMRRLGPPPEDPLLKETFRQLSTAVMGANMRDKKKPPYEFADYERLMDIARRARNGDPITKDDDQWMMGILLQGMPTPEEMIAKAKKPVDLDAKEREAEKKEREAEKKAAAEEGKPVRGARGGREEKPAEGEKAGAEKGEAKGGEAPKAEEKPARGAREERAAKAEEKAAAPAEKPAEKAAEKPQDAAASRKAQREAEIAAMRAARGGKKDESKAEEKKPEPKKDEPQPPPAAGDAADDDPLGYQS